MTDKSGIVHSVERIETDSGTKKTRMTRHLRHSNFGVTINTNQRYGEHDEGLAEAKKKLDKVIGHILNFDNINNFIKFTKKPDDGAVFNRKWIKDYHATYSIERSRKNNLLHAHFGAEFSHYTAIQMNIDALHKYVCDELGLKNIYLNIKAIPSGGMEKWLNYIMKDMVAEGDVIEVEPK